MSAPLQTPPLSLLNTTSQCLLFFNKLHALENRLHFWNYRNEICEELNLLHNDEFNSIHTTFLVLLGGYGGVQ
jgi:hypothetical protein